VILTPLSLLLTKHQQTLDLSNYQPLSSSTTTLDSDDTPLAASTHSKKVLPLPGSASSLPSSPSTRAHQMKRIGESGMEALAQAIKGSIRLNQLVLNGHDLSPKMCQDLLNAMDESRVCTIVADFKSYKWRLDEVLASMKAERALLSSCYTPKSLRVHLCGQTNSKKYRMLRGWYDSQQLPFWTGIFGPSVDTSENYGIELLKLSLLNRSADMNFWCYDGQNQLHELYRLHLRATPLSVAIITVSSVGSTGQCRSAAQVAVELISWIRLLITFGHQTRDLAIILTNGVLFDKAWHGVDPSCVGVPSSIDELGQSTSSVEPSSHSSEKKEEDLSSHDDRGGANTKAVESPDAASDRLGRLDTSTLSASLKQVPSEEQIPLPIHNTEADTRRRFEESIHEQISSLLGWKKTPQLFCWDEGEKGPMPLKVDQWLSERYKSQSQHVQVPNLCAIIREQCLPILRQGSNPLLQQLSASSQHRQVDGSQQLQSHGPQQVISMNHLLKHCKQYVRCLQLVELRQACQWLHLLGDIVIYDTLELDSYEIDMWNYLRNKDDSSSCFFPPSEDHEGLHHHHHKSLDGTGQHQNQTMSEETMTADDQEMNTEIKQKLRVIDSKRLKIQIDLELMKKQAPKRNCKIILNPNWFSRYILLGFIYQQTTDPSGGGVISSTTTSTSTATCSPTSSSTSVVLPPQPWCPHEYKYTYQQIYDHIFPYMSQLNQQMTITELLIALEVQRIGILLPAISSFCLPCRLQGNKFKWLSERLVTKMSLSQYSSGYTSRGGVGVGDVLSMSITSALGRRIKAKFPYIFPPSTFSCLQSHILHTWITEKDTTWKYYRVVLWERGIGITIEQPPAQQIKGTQKGKKSFSPKTAAAAAVPSPSHPLPSSSTADEGKLCGQGGVTERAVDTSSPAPSLSSPPPDDETKEFSVGTGSGFICVLIEMTAKATQPDWTQNPDSVIDLMIWGEGVCDNTQLPTVLKQFIQLTYTACQLVCQGALRSEGASVDALMPPLIDWLKVTYLKPGCFLHTLACPAHERNCGEYLEDKDFNDPPEAPILVMCHHLQPRLMKTHLLEGYRLADSPGQGKGLLRSVYSSLERCVEIASSPNQETASVVSPVSGGGGGSGAGIGSGVGIAGGGEGNGSNSAYDDYIYDIQSTSIASE
jgi:hypothetical protein